MVCSNERGREGGLKCTNKLTGGRSNKMYKLSGGRSNKTVTWIKYVSHIHSFEKFTSQNKGGGGVGGLSSIYKYQPNKAYIISFVRSLKTGTSHKLRIQVKLNISSNFYNYSLCFLADRALQRLIT